ncbi:MAG: succinate dehydrogenase assembly factor 2 [Immundisolibacteraceae bacterium]|nr:succinate dehydrogenase assembly factor 2 [Immundisolibacteraceae bacterium]
MVDLGSLKWQLRRGKLELDIVLQRFRQRYPFEQLSDQELQALADLLELSDEELLDMFLDRNQPSAPDQQQMLKKILDAAHSNPG